MKRAVILAGGRGTRLKPYTVALPKPLMPIGEYPILEIIIRQLSGFGFTHVTLAVNHQADIIKAYFQDGKKWNIFIDYSLETTPLSTMGPLKLIDDLPEHFLVMNGDVLSDIGYASFMNEHEQSNRIFSVLAHRRHEQVNYGVLKTDQQLLLTEFDEKPVHNYLVSMGIYAVSRSVLEYIPENIPFGFDNLMGAFIHQGIKVNVVPYEGYWMDIGRPEDYLQATEEFDKIRHELNIEESL